LSLFLALRHLARNAVPAQSLSRQRFAERRFSVVFS
jgi:hypothetical protein